VPAATPLPRAPSVLTLYSAADLLTGPGCPVCRYAAEASDRYLGWFALEGHSQPAAITRLCGSLGMCAAHTRRLMNQPGAAVRLTAVYRYVVTSARDRLAGRTHRPAACPGCEHDGAAAQRALATLLEDLSDSAVMRRCCELGGLCLPHLAAASSAARPRLVAPLVEAMRDTITARDSRCDWLTGTDRDAKARAALRGAIAAARPPPPAECSPGPVACSPCLASAQAERDALAALADPASRAPGPALTLCAGHLADAAEAAGAHGLRQLLAWQLQCLTAPQPAGRPRWPRMTTRHPEPLGRCAICHARQAAVPRMLADLSTRADLSGHPHGRATAACLCVRHHLMFRTDHPRAARDLARAAVGRADLLATELSDAFDRAAWAHSGGVPVPQSTAWRRAAAFLDGSVFGGLSWPLPTGALRE
jgi:hypothetical protein